MAITDDQFKQVIEEAAQGKGVIQAIQDAGATRQDFYRRIVADAASMDQYVRAKYLGCHAFADDSVHIQDEEPRKVDTKFGTACDAAWVAWQKNRVELRRWHLAKLMPKTYGDKLEHVGNADQPIAVTISGTDAKL